MNAREPDDFDDASRWRDWLQPILFDNQELIAEAVNEEATNARIGDASYTIQTPPRPVERQSEAPTE